jgi:hypothetical protein
MNKINAILAVILLCLTISCKKEKKETPAPPTPTLEIRFGYLKGGFDLTLFKDQNSIPHDSIDSLEYFGISIMETNLPFSTKTDTLVFEYDVRTKNDLEHIDSRTFVGGKSTYAMSFITKEIGGDFYIPCKIAAVAKHNNDTIEFSSAAEYISIDYKSHHSSLKGRDSLAIKP